MSQFSPQNILDEIYAEGDLDMIFFGFIAGPVNFDSEDNSYGKTDLEHFEDTLALIQYLSNTGDFQLGRMLRVEEGVKFVAYTNGFIEFKENARHKLENEGLRCPALSWELALRKIKKGKTAPKIPNSISQIFQPRATD